MSLAFHFDYLGAAVLVADAAAGGGRRPAGGAFAVEPPRWRTLRCLVAAINSWAVHGSDRPADDAVDDDEIVVTPVGAGIHATKSVELSTS
jgi:hypothetical protein